MTELGYPLEWFVESIDAYLTCGICCNVLKHPLTTECGHVYCAICIQSWIEIYGVCPERCGEVDVESLRRVDYLDKKISCLHTLCKYYKAGCKSSIQFFEKESHERKCRYAKKSVFKARSFNLFNSEASSLSQPDPEECRHYRSKSDRSRHRRTHLTNTSESHEVPNLSHQVHKRSKSIGFGSTSRLIGLTKRSPSCATVHPLPKPMKMQSQHTYRLKRTKPKESLGLVLLSGEKNADGKPECFYVKEVHPGTLAWNAGMKAGDRIVQVDFHTLTLIAPEEAVARIKDKPMVTLTVLRGLVPPSTSHKQGSSYIDHIYDEILYADQQQSLQHDDGFLLQDSGRRHRTGMVMNEGELLRINSNPNRRTISPLGLQNQHQHVSGNQSTLPGEKGSKDSGLSSGSSTSPEHKRRVDRCEDGEVHTKDAQFGKSTNERKSYRKEREILHNFLKTRRENSKQLEIEEADSRSRMNSRIEGDYEIEDIYLQKSGTSQLGITLGYDTKTAKGRLYVCEILTTGLAYQDGRLRCGDIIQRVNGFEVYDPEEAILLFLEQDQDITLTVARKMKVVTNHHLTSPTQPNPPPVEHNYAVLEDITGINTSLRRTDSCGSLDSHSHKYVKGYSKADMIDQDEEFETRKIFGSGSRLRLNEEPDYEYMSRTRETQLRDISPRRLLPNLGMRSSSRSPPRNPSPLCRSFGQLPKADSPSEDRRQLSYSKSQVTRPTFLSNDNSFRHIQLNHSSPRCKTASNEHIPTNVPMVFVRSRTPHPECKHAVISTTSQTESYEFEPKAWSPNPDGIRMLSVNGRPIPGSTTSDGVRMVPVNFRSVSSDGCRSRMSSKSEGSDYRSESLV